MRDVKKYLVTFIIIATISLSTKAQQELPGIPHLQKRDGITQIIVDGKPFLMLAGELGNSSASDLNYMRPIWDKLVKMNLNTVLVPVYWELIEPEEGKYDFTLVDSLIYSARQNNLKIVFLWFGSWKNSMSCYAPYWVKENQKRFPRARTNNGKAVEILSPFYEENVKADAGTFAELLSHICKVDREKHTVIMVQVENEIGMIPEARDYCDEANKKFNGLVPTELINYLEANKENLIPELYDVWKTAGFKTSGKWEEVFGKGLHTDEIFMAWYFALYTNCVAEAGKKEYPLPMYVNAALIRPDYKPGQYPSAGPLPHLIDVWRAAAPKIDFLSPDIYFQNFAEWCSKYDRSGNPLFIPEVGNDQSMANAFYAIAKHNAMGYSPFSIESLDNPENNKVHKAYNVLKQLSLFILSNQGKGTMNAVLLDSVNHKVQIKLGDYGFNFKHEYSWAYASKTEGDNPRFGAMVLMLSPDEFLIAGSGVIVTFEANTNNGDIAGIDSIDEITFEDGIMKTGVRMNGDQSHQGRHMQLPGNSFGIRKVKLYQYK